MPINRAEFVKIIVGAFTKTPQGSNCFKDVSNEWFAPYVCEAKTKGLLSGYEDGTFKPSNIITFSEASKIIAIAINAEGEKGTQWYQQYVTALENKNAIPFSITTFDQYLKRADMAEIMYRLKANITTKPSRTYKELAGADFMEVASCAALLERMKESSQYNPYFYPETDRGGGGYISSATSGGGGGFMETQDASTSSSAGHYDNYYYNDGSFSTTNLQVEGVDEPDIINNDGQNVYLIKDTTVRVMRRIRPTNFKKNQYWFLVMMTIKIFIPNRFILVIIS